MLEDAEEGLLEVVPEPLELALLVRERADLREDGAAAVVVLLPGRREPAVATTLFITSSPTHQSFNFR